MADRRDPGAHRGLMRRAGPVALAVAAACLVLLAASGASGGNDTVVAGAAARRGLRLVKVGSFAEPTYVTAPPGDKRRVFVVEQAGRIRLVLDGKPVAEPFLDIRDLVTSGGEQGLLSVAFAPDYATSRRFYVYYTDTGEQQRVVEYHAATEDRADPGTARLVLKMADHESNHNGGLLLFGPDKHLYIGTGDGGGGGDRHGARGNAQNRDSLLGKVLRIDPAAGGGSPYTVPQDNPFSGGQNGRPEVYAYGLRNPWRFSFDRKTGDLSIGDVGQNAVEEIDFVRRGKGRGANFGWRVFEGNSRYTSGESAPGGVKPVLTQRHSDGNCSITGGVIGRDRAVPSAYGRYLFGDYCKGLIYRARLKPGRARSVKPSGLQVGGLASFGEDARGRIYVVSNHGPVYRLTHR